MLNDRPDEPARRTYWTEQMDLAGRLAANITEYPVEECGEGLVSLPEAAAAEKVRVRFSASPTVPGHQRIFSLREGLIAPFLAAAGEMNGRGWVLKVEDGFRTRRMQKLLARKQPVFDAILKRVIWEHGGRLPSVDLVARRLAVLVAGNAKVGTHMSGSAMDISVVRADDGSELDRGGPYLEMSELTPMGSPFVPEPARANRAEITALLGRHGFAAYPYEFWHYCQGDALAGCLSGSGRPARYGPIDWDPATGAVKPIDRPEMPLNSMEEIQAEIEQAMARLGQDSSPLDRRRR